MKVYIAQTIDKADGEVMQIEASVNSEDEAIAKLTDAFIDSFGNPRDGTREWDEIVAGDHQFRMCVDVINI